MCMPLFRTRQYLESSLPGADPPYLWNVLGPSRPGLAATCLRTTTPSGAALVRDTVRSVVRARRVLDTCDIRCGRHRT